MDRTQIFIQLRDIISDVLDIPDLEITEVTGAVDVPDWDSLNHVRIIAATEQKFSIRLASSEIEKLKNVGDFVTLIAAKQA